MKAIPLASPLIEIGDDLAEVIDRLVFDTDLEQSVLVITSKVVAVAEGSVKQCKTKDQFDTLVKSEADEVLGASQEFGFYLTKKNGMMMPNAGIDSSNAPLGTAILLPKNSQASADLIRNYFMEKYKLKHFGVIIADSRVVPFRLGISGVALAWVGFTGVSDERGKNDLYGKPLKVSRLAVADNLAGFAQNYFGQANERVPFVLLQNPPVEFTDVKQNSKSAAIRPEDDLYGAFWKSNRQGQ